MPARPAERHALAEPWRQRAHAGELEGAELAYRHALLEEGPDPELCFNLGNVLLAMGRHEQAIERFRQAVEMDTDYPEAWKNLGSAMEELNQMPEAIDAYRRAIALNPQYGDPYHNLADLLDQAGQVQEAQRLWRVYYGWSPKGSGRSTRSSQHARASTGSAEPGPRAGGDPS